MPICHGKHNLTINIGKLPNVLVVRCTRVRHNQNALAKAVTRATNLSLGPQPSPSEMVERMLYVVGRTRRLPAYNNLWPKAKAVIEHLVREVIVREEMSGEVLCSKKNWMLALDTQSSSQTNKAIGGRSFSPRKRYHANNGSPAPEPSRTQASAANRA
jgi:hypothetical protein